INREIADYIVFFNEQRPAYSLNYLTPKQYKEYYFGNQEGQHIAFSRKVNSLKPSLLNSRTVYRPRTYALQSIWEEASNATASYSSLWNDPVIVGIY
ncbi:MAG: IS3 family transposase, partial [Treponema sp.]|nr:IS3 family transposase [Treponema sp.]